MHQIRPRYNDFMDFELPKKKRFVKPRPKKMRKILLINFLILMVIGIVNVGAYFYLNAPKGQEENISKAGTQESINNLTPEVKGIDTCQNPVDSELNKAFYWWDDNYHYYREINVIKQDGFNENNSVSFSLDHQNLVQNGKSKPDGSDIRVVGRDGNDFFPINFKIENANSNSTKVTFEYRTYEQILMYYGNTSANAVSNSISNQNEVGTYSITYSDETTYPISINLNRKWVLIGYDKSELNLDVKLSPSLKINLPLVNYEVLTTGVGSAIIPENNLYKATISTDELKPGEYFVQATLTDDCFTIKSPKVKFTLSYPVFVSWTMDWEGYSTNKIHMDQIETLSSKYGVPLTQFFNPRIYITSSIRQDNKDLMTSWMKGRQAKGDEVGLHLHMWKDMVRLAGVAPKDRPQWDVMNTGYDVLFSAYSFEESDKIIAWSLSELEKHGFTNITSFRAGGWEIDPENFQALEKNGIKLDSSGRTFHKHGTQLIPSVWNLTPTTKPYLPSKSDLNKSSTDNFNVWEFPNNGADSYIYSYDQMKDRFNENYKGGIATEPQVITYLSHPHWFNTDYPKLDKLFADFESKKFEKDQGPLVYTTLNDARIYWENLD